LPIIYNDEKKQTKMKKILLFITLISFGFAKGQIVNIPDINFKNKLINHNPIIDTNNDNEIQNSEAVAFQGVVKVQNHTNTGLIENLTGIEEFINITGLHCYGNLITTLDVSQNTQIIELYCSGNLLNDLNIAGLNNLTYFSCDDNNLSSLDVSGLTIEGEGLYCNNNNLTSLILNNSTINYISCDNNNLTELDLSSVNSVYSLDCSNNQLSNIIFNNNVNLNYINCNNNNLSNLNLNGLINLQNLFCSNNVIATLDLSNKFNLTRLNCSNNLDLNYINLRNGNNINYNIDPTLDNFINLPSLETICVDELNNLDFINFINNQVNHSIAYTEYCSLLPSQSNLINGIVQLDLNNNGCDVSDLSMSNLMIVSNNGTDNFATFTQNNGSYLLHTSEGIFTTEVTTDLPNYYSANPSSQTNNFTGFDNMFTANFCIEASQTVNDVNITLIPTSQAKPGFNTTYQIVFKNVGTTQLNGDVTLEFDETKLSFLNATETVNTQTSNSLTFNYSNLNPFEIRIIDLEFNVFAPPTVNIDDVLSFTATINPIASDFTTDDNIFTLDQTVIGSYDPNDITCLEGNQILLADADKYLHYVIRFQNTGTASAINVVVTNDLDVNLDWSTLQLESLSHNNRVAIKNGNEIEFIFENINLPDSTTDEPNSHGFIAYKIKPKTDIVLGDIIPNKADIFFDFNAPIETNTATTTIVNVLAVNENRLLDFSVFPTPTENILNIKSKKEIVKIEIYSKLGQLILKNTTENKIDISNLNQGLYFVKVEDVNGNFGVKKIVKR